MLEDQEIGQLARLDQWGMRTTNYNDMNRAGNHNNATMDIETIGATQTQQNHLRTYHCAFALRERSIVLTRFRFASANCCKCPRLGVMLSKLQMPGPQLGPELYHNHGAAK